MYSGQWSDTAFIKWRHYLWLTYVMQINRIRFMQAVFECISLWYTTWYFWCNIFFGISLPGVNKRTCYLIGWRWRWWRIMNIILWITLWLSHDSYDHGIMTHRIPWLKVWHSLQSFNKNLFLISVIVISEG